MSSECEKLIDWIMSYFDPHWESLGPEKRDEILVKAKQLFQAAILEVLRSDEGKAVVREVVDNMICEKCEQKACEKAMRDMGFRESEASDGTR